MAPSVSRSQTELSRRTLLSAGAAAAVGAAGAAGLLSSGRTEAGLLLFESPPVQPYVDALTVPSRVTGGAIDLPMAQGWHRFHRDYPGSRTWGYAGTAYHGPVVEARQGEPVVMRAPNRLGRHALAGQVDTTMMDVTQRDVVAPRSNIHLHGSFSEPAHDGHPYDTYRPGMTRDYRYANDEGARHLWFHDHTMGMTRLNVAAGLASTYLVRDHFDTGGPDNTLGLPWGECELPLVIEDKMFDPDGRMWYRFTPLAAENRWGGTFYGDRTVVNGTVWPRLTVARGVYRFRLQNSAAATAYTLGVGGAVPMHVIGTELGLLDAPVPVSSLTIASGERYDVLVDFTDAEPGTRIELRNTQPPQDVDRLLGARTVPQVMAFDVSSETGPVRRVPTALRGGRRQPPRLPAVPTPSLTRVMTLGQSVELQHFPPVRLTLNNLDFMTDQVDVGRAGTTELWEVANTTTLVHPVHVHMATLRVVDRQPFSPALYQLLNPTPAFGTSWRPADPGGYLGGRRTGPAPYERGEKDTVLAAASSVTRFTVTWPSGRQLGFDPDAPYRAGALVTPDGGTRPGRRAPGAAMGEGTGRSVRGYVWHCHFLDHEDHDMMLPIRFAL